MRASEFIKVGPVHRATSTGNPPKVNGILETIEAASKWSRKHPNPMWKRNRQQKGMR